jgi:hypothetical protein
MSVSETYSYSLIIRDCFYDHLSSAPYFASFAMKRKSRALQIQPQHLPYLGVYVVGEDMTSDGDANAGYIAFVHTLRIGFSVVVVNNDPVLCEKQLVQAHWAIMNRLWRDQYLMNMIDTRSYPGGIGNPDNTRVEGIAGGNVRFVYGSSVSGSNETPIGEMQYEARCIYRSTWEPVITDDFLEMQLRTGVKIGDTEEEMAKRQQVGARYTFQQSADLVAQPATVTGSE